VLYELTVYSTTFSSCVSSLHTCGLDVCLFLSSPRSPIEVFSESHPLQAARNTLIRVPLLQIAYRITESENCIPALPITQSAALTPHYRLSVLSALFQKTCCDLVQEPYAYLLTADATFTSSLFPIGSRCIRRFRFISAASTTTTHDKATPLPSLQLKGSALFGFWLRKAGV
jgi:hypothetical protein